MTDLDKIKREIDRIGTEFSVSKEELHRLFVQEDYARDELTSVELDLDAMVADYRKTISGNAREALQRYEAAGRAVAEKQAEVDRFAKQFEEAKAVRAAVAAVEAWQALHP